MLPKKHSSAAHLIAAALLATANACTEQTTPTAIRPIAPNAALVAAAGPNSGKVKVKTFQLSANTLRIDGPAITGQVSIGNSGSPIQSGVSLRAEITQGAATREAASLPTQCNPGDTPGFLPPNNCDMTFGAAASNSAVGSGTLVPGAATFVLHVMQTTVSGETELANKSILVNLIAPPSITTLTLAPTTLVIDGPASTYTATMQNPANSLQGMLLQGWIVQGATKRAAGGSLVTCGSNVGVFPPGTCTMTLSASASSSASGNGTLVQGPAVFELDLMQNSGTVVTTFDVKTVAITLAKPTITSLVLTSTTLVLNGPSVDYTAELQNLGPAVSDVLLQGELVQNQGGTTVTVGAGGTGINCGAGFGVLPTTAPGTCSIPFVVTASTTAGGNGTLTFGPAQFVLHLYKAPASGPLTEFDTKTVAVTIVAPASITSITPNSSFIVLGASFTSYTATVQNDGPALSDVSIQGWIVQGSARRAAGGTIIRCPGAEDGTLPTGTCIAPSDIVASNVTSGTGTLVLGPATFELDLRVGLGATVIDTKFIPITLVASTPSIVSISLATSSLVIDGAQSNFSAVVYNPTGAPLSGVLVQEWIDQGLTTSRAAGGTVLTCTGTIAEMPPGSCVVSFTMGASNGSSGSGTLAAGGATFRLQLIQGATVLDTKTVAITLTSP